MQSEFSEPLNIGSDQMVSINQLVDIAAEIGKKSVVKRHNLTAPTGVRGRNSDNRLIRKTLGWDFEVSLERGIELTYNWVASQLNAKK
jgi:nucleoside-diphosphate-sugar epimerase